ncbi:hypothetical protein [Cylindrospermum stagnale]|uniref:hypothetical protein n=1 Tax=Cylindrospermum stagnale TaxID=142864 RepID=UPI00059DF05D|nr:hypothetical protein [Cylindrospermum stagnale]
MFHVTGITKTDSIAIEAAAKVAANFRKIGVKVIFLNESNIELPEIGAALLIAGLVMGAIAAIIFIH